MNVSEENEPPGYSLLRSFMQLQEEMGNYDHRAWVSPVYQAHGPIPLPDSETKSKQAKAPADSSKLLYYEIKLVDDNAKSVDSVVNKEEGVSYKIQARQSISLILTHINR